MAKGFLQRFGVDYDETYAPVARYPSIRALLALTAHHDWELHQMDVKSAYLNGDLDEEIYMSQPDGYDVPETNLVCKLNKSLYGLKQAARTWHLKMDDALKEHGFTALAADQCVYTRVQDGHVIVIALYVDDLLLASDDLTTLAKLKRALAARFEMEDMGEASFILGIDIRRDRTARTVSIGQAAYVIAVLQRHGMNDCKPAVAPMSRDAASDLVKSPDDLVVTEATTREYQAIIGGVMFAMLCTRPDIAFAVTRLAQYASKPSPAHMVALKHLMRYLRGTIDQRITYTGSGSVSGQPALIGYCDADWGQRLDDRRSVTGYVFMLAGGAISLAEQEAEDRRAVHGRGRVHGHDAGDQGGHLVALLPRRARTRRHRSDRAPLRQPGQHRTGEEPRPPRADQAHRRAVPLHPPARRAAHDRPAVRGHGRHGGRHPHQVPGARRPREGQAAARHAGIGPSSRGGVGDGSLSPCTACTE